MGWFDGLLGGGGGGGGGDYAGLLSGGGNIDYNKLLQQELANADNAKWAALSGALAEAGMPSRLPVPIGSAIGKAAAAFGGGENNSLLKILQIQKLATETQSLKELSELRKKLSDDDKPFMDLLIKYNAVPGAGQPNAPSGGGGGASGTVAGGSGGGTLTGEAIPIGQPGNPGSLAMEHAPETQEQVAKKIATTSGLQHWAGEWNPKLQADLRAAGLPLSGPVSEEQWNAAKPLILQRESEGGKNIPNYRFDATHTAGGPFQITNSTWKNFGGPDIATAANAAAAARPLPSAFDLPKFSGLLGDSTDAEQPSIQATPDGGGLLNPGTPSAQLRGDASRVVTSLGPPGSYRINSKGQPYSIELETMPPDEKAKVAEAMRGIKERMRAGSGSGGGVPDIPPGDAGGGDGGGFLPGDLARGIQPGQGPLAIPRPAGLPPMPAAPAAPLGGLLAPPQAPVAPPAGPGLLATPQAPAAAPVSPAAPALGPAPASAPGSIPAPNTQATQQLLAIIAQRRKQAALAGITGDPYGAYRDMILNSPRYLAEKAATERAATHPYALDEKRFGTDEELRAFLAKSPEERARIAIKADLDRRNALAGQGINLDPSGQATEIPGFGTTKATIEGQTADVQARIKAGQENTEINVPVTDPATGFKTNHKFSVTREEQGMYSRGEGIPRLGIPARGDAGPGVPNAAGAAAPGGPGPLGGAPTNEPGSAEMAKDAATGYSDAQKAAAAANKHTQVLGQMAEAMKGFQPGATAELRYNAQKALKDLGFIQGNEVPSAETFQKAGRYLQVAAAPKGQGSTSNYEREIYAGAVPSMVDSPEGLVRAIGIAQRLDDYDRKVAQIWLESASRTGVPNSVQAQTRIAALGPPLSPGELGALQEIKEGKRPTQTNAGIPEGAKPVGTYQGKPVYQMPDGSRKVMQ